jgi:hypothetical protein
MTRQERDADAIAAFIRNKGVTRCPTVCAVPTQASIATTDRRALRQRDAEKDAQREARRLRELALYRFGQAAGAAF